MEITYEIVLSAPLHL